MRNFDPGKNRHPSTDRLKFVAVDNYYVREVNNAIPDFVQYVHGGLRARRVRYVKYNKFVCLFGWLVACLFVYYYYNYKHYTDTNNKQSASVLRH